MYFGQNKFHEDWSWHTEAQHRNRTVGMDLEQLLLRTGINRHYDRGVFTLGYAHIRNQDPEGEWSMVEHRIWQQWIRNHSFGKLKVNDRYRIEQRFIDRAPDNGFDGELEHRFRYNLWFLFPLVGEEIDKGTPFLSAYDEIFIGATSQPFDQNRLYLAGGYALRDDLHLQAGFLWQHIGLRQQPFRRTQLSITFNPKLY